MKEPSRDVGRAEKPAFDPNEMRSLALKFESNRQMPPQFASASEIQPRTAPPPPASRLRSHRDVMEPGLDIIKSEPRPNLGQFLPINSAGAMLDCRARRG